MLNKSSQKVLEVLEAFAGERLSDREIMDLAQIRSQQTLTRAKKELSKKGYVKYEATRQGTNYILNDQSAHETGAQNGRTKRAHNGRTTGAPKKSLYMLYEDESKSAPPPPPQGEGSIDDLTFSGGSIEEKLDELMKAWVGDPQMPTLYNRQVKKMRQYVLVDRTATPEQWLQAVFDAQDKNSPDGHHRGINFNFIEYQLKQAIKRKARQARKGELRDEISNGKGSTGGFSVGENGEGLANDGAGTKAVVVAGNGGTVVGASSGEVCGEFAENSGAVQFGRRGGQEPDKRNNSGRRTAEEFMRELRGRKLQSAGPHRADRTDSDKRGDAQRGEISFGDVSEVGGGAPAGERVPKRTAAEILGRYFIQPESGAGQRTGDTNGGQALGDVPRQPVSVWGAGLRENNVISTNRQGIFTNGQNGSISGRSEFIGGFTVDVQRQEQSRAILADNGALQAL